MVVSFGLTAKVRRVEHNSMLITLSINENNEQRGTVTNTSTVLKRALIGQASICKPLPVGLPVANVGRTGRYQTEPIIIVSR